MLSNIDIVSKSDRLVIYRLDNFMCKVDLSNNIIERVTVFNHDHDIVGGVVIINNIECFGRGDNKFTMMFLIKAKIDIKKYNCSKYLIFREVDLYKDIMWLISKIAFQ
jgi:hypothetical protein